LLTNQCRKRLFSKINIIQLHKKTNRTKITCAKTSKQIKKKAKIIKKIHATK